MMTNMIHEPANVPARTRPADGLERWLTWRADVQTRLETVTIVDLAECRCPDLCDLDHANE